MSFNLVLLILASSDPGKFLIKDISSICYWRSKPSTLLAVRMQRLFNKNSDQTVTDSLAPLFGNHSSLSYSAKQQHHSLSNKLASDLEKQSNSRYQGHDLSSSLSTSKSHHEPATLARRNFFMQSIAFKPGFSETYKKNGEDYMKPSLPCGNADQINHQVQMEHNQSLACISCPLAEPYVGRIFSAYGPNSVVFPQVMEFTPARAVLPLDCTEGMPIYVNAKQYQAILRRRQTRAKLEAQNKLAKSRKPYLHESRHLHAMKRARGSGGRFLNTKSMPQSKLSSQLHGRNISLEQVNGDASEPDIQHSQSNSWGTSTTSSSAVSCIFNSDDQVFQQPKFRALSSSFPMGATACIGAYSHATTPDDRLLLSIDTCARISTADCVV